MEEEKEIDGRIDMDGGHRGKGGKWDGKRPHCNVLGCVMEERRGQGEEVACRLKSTSGAIT